MEDKTVTLNQHDVDSIIDEYGKQRARLDELTVEFSGVNELDTLLLLKTMSVKSPTVNDLAPVCEIMLDGRTINFKYKGTGIYHPVAYSRGNGNALHLMFTDAPYLYDFLQQTIYALLLKKLTPHLEGSN